MSKAQFRTLNLVGGICALLVVGNVMLGYSNGLLNRSVSSVQTQFNQAQQMQTTAQNLVLRISQAGQRDNALRDLLVRHNFKVSTAPDAQAKTTP